MHSDSSIDSGVPPEVPPSPSATNLECSSSSTNRRIALHTKSIDARSAGWAKTVNEMYGLSHWAGSFGRREGTQTLHVLGDRRQSVLRDELAWRRGRVHWTVARDACHRYSRRGGSSAANQLQLAHLRVSC